jgi:hypothetical protein
VILEGELPAVKGLELRPVPDAHDGRVGEALVDEPQQRFLASRVERRRRLVHHHDVGTLHEQPGEREALFLSARQDAAPRRFLVETLVQVAERDGLECIA